MSQSDLVEAEIRRLGVKGEDPTQMMIASLTDTIVNIQLTLNKEIAGLKELVKHQGQIIDELQKRFKKPIRIEINKEERERIQAIEEKLDRVDHTAQRAAHITIHGFTPSPKTPWKTSAEIQISDTNETTPVHPIEKPTVTQIPLLLSPASDYSRLQASRIAKSTAVIPPSPVSRVVTKPFGL